MWFEGQNQKCGKCDPKRKAQKSGVCRSLTPSCEGVSVVSILKYGTVRERRRFTTARKARNLLYTKQSVTEVDWRERERRREEQKKKKIAVLFF